MAAATKKTLRLTDKITEIPQIGPKTALDFEKLEIFSVGELLQTYPRRYLDLSKIKKITELSEDSLSTFHARITKFKQIYLRGKGKRTMQTAVLEDPEDNQIKLPVVWFNYNYLEDSIRDGEVYSFVGRISTNQRTGKPQVVAPDFEKVDQKLHSSRIVPVYSLTSGISPKMYRRYIKNALDLVEHDEWKDLFVSESLLKVTFSKLLPEKKLISVKNAIENMHFPEDMETLELAKLQLGVMELVPYQLKLAEEYASRIANPTIIDNFKEKVGSKLDFDKVFNDYWEKYNFKPTTDQIKACKDIWEDFMKNKPSWRLLQGDVGTGKTAVAGFATYLALFSGTHVIIMAPTTVLANQHYHKFSQLFGEESVQLITSETDIGKNKPFKNQTTKPHVFIGTQALLSRKSNLFDHHNQSKKTNKKIKNKAENILPGMIIIDEEHRFGVGQREQLAKLKFTGKLPHYLSMTATPIPRSLTLALFGQVEVSVIQTKPAQQKPRETMLVPESKRESAYDWIRTQIKKRNTQIFWICPLIETKKIVDNTEVINTQSEKNSVAKVYKELKEIYPDMKIKQLHGKLKDSTKTKILTDFQDKKFDILVSTTVVEVGIDIPGANLMVIESATNFGLAQLHQLRGRVGRAADHGTCLIFTGSETATERLRVFSEEENGLRLAEFDLKTRGPGEVYGTRQSGIPQFKVADFMNKDQLMISQDIAKSIMMQKTQV